MNLIMVGEVKWLGLAGGESLDNFSPDNPEDFRVDLRAMIGPKTSPGKESFDITVCTPKWLMQECATGSVFGRHRLIVATWSPNVIAETLDRLVQRQGGDSWQEIAGKLARYAYWEFEDYADTT